MVRSGLPGATLRIPVLNPRLWTPEDPFLYDIKVRLIGRSGKVVDEVSSYAGLRTIGVVNDGKGRPRIALNGRITFLHGPLDQGYWPESGLTAPDDAAFALVLDAWSERGQAHPVGDARRSLDLALYDVRLPGEPAGHQSQQCSRVGDVDVPPQVEGAVEVR